LLNKQNDQRRRQAERYSQAIRNPYITLPYGGQEADKSVWHIYPIFCQHRQQLRDWLAAHGIGTNIHYPTPPHRQAAYAELNSTSLPVAEQLCATELSLPLNPTLTAGEQDYIIDALNRFHL
jgi:dTDP-4-amino-4,6-dideoxygalactose transaminase